MNDIFDNMSVLITIGTGSLGKLLDRLLKNHNLKVIILSG